MVGAMEDRTYIKIFRKMLGWGWYGDTNTFRVFMHILLKANYQESEYRGYKIPAGSCVFGRKAWAKELGLSERQIRTALEHLKSTNEVTTKTTNKFTIVHVENWGFWQIEEGKATTKTTNKKSNERPTSDQQPTTSKESKNNKDIDIDIYRVEFEALWKLYPKKRGKDKAFEHFKRDRQKGIPYEEIKNGTIAYAEWVKTEVSEDRYIKHGSTFFSQRAWQDDWTRSDRHDDRGSNAERKGVRGSAGTGDRSMGTGKVPSWYKPLTSATALVEDAGSKDDA